MQDIDRWEETLSLHEVGFYRLPNGAVIAVGNVVTCRGEDVVTVSVLPAGYADDPLVGYDYHRREAAGGALAGKVMRLRLVSLQKGTPDAPGQVVLRL